MRLRGILYEFPPFAKSLNGLTSAQWFETSTKYVDVLKALEDRLTGDFTATVRAVASDARWGFWSIVAIFVVMSAITCVLSTVVMLSITRPIAQLVPHHGRAGAGSQRHRRPWRRARRRDRSHGACRRGVPRRRGREGAAGSRERRAARAAPRRSGARMPPVQAEAAEEQAAAMRALAEGLGKLAEGDLAFRLSGGLTEAYRQIGEDFNATTAQLQDTIRAIALATREVASTAAEISTNHHRPLPAYRGAGRQPGTDLGLDGGDLCDREEERRERPADQSIRQRHPRGRRPRRRRGGAGGRARWRGSRNPRGRSPTSSA